MSAGMIRAIACRGLGLVEFLVALLVVSSSLLALLKAQQAGARLGNEAQQRSVATRLARDLILRIELNPGQLQRYLVTGPQDPVWSQLTPSLDCLEQTCTAAQLADYERWHWLAQLSSHPLTGAPGAAQLPACVGHDGATVVVSVGWRERRAVDETAVDETDYSCRQGLLLRANGQDRAVFPVVSLTSFLPVRGAP